MKTERLPERFSALLKQSESELELASELTTPVTANALLHAAREEDVAKDAEVERTARRIALIATEQIDEGSLIGYPSLDPAYAAFVETVIFYAARGVIES